jgi:hypothetical protein
VKHFRGYSESADLVDRVRILQNPVFNCVRFKYEWSGVHGDGSHDSFDEFILIAFFGQVFLGEFGAFNCMVFSFRSVYGQIVQDRSLEQLRQDLPFS